MAHVCGLMFGMLCWLNETAPRRILTKRKLVAAVLEKQKQMHAEAELS